MNVTNTLALGLPVSLDRSAHWRKDPERLKAALSDQRAGVVLVWRSQNLVVIDDRTSLLRLPVTAIAQFGRQPEDLWCLGLGEDSSPVFALDISEVDQPAPDRIAGAEAGTFSELRQIATLLGAEDANIAAYSRALATWHYNHQHCGRCGAATVVESAGHVRRCAPCEREWFPRTDPAVIMLVHDGGDRCLLGRQASWPPGVYSTLAGFVEPGESLEMAVAREVFEESGVVVTAAHYHSSQPWPFPTSVMLGFMAQAEHADGAIAMDDELEDARWFGAEELRIATRTKEVRLPHPMSISRRLVDDWMASRFSVS